MLKRFGFALGAILAVGMLASCVINTSSDDDDVKDVVDYSDYSKSGDYCIKLKNNTGVNLVCFKGTPSAGSLLGGVRATSSSALKKNSSLFTTSQDFVLFLVKEDDYKANKDSLETLKNAPFGQVYCYWNEETPNTRVYEISAHMGGSSTLIVNNNTKFNVELREGGLYEAPIGYVASMDLQKKFPLETEFYYVYPVFRKFDKKSGEILSQFPTYSDTGNNVVVPFGFDNETSQLEFDAKNWVGNTNFKMSPSCSYLAINNSSAGAIQLYDGNSTALQTTSGYTTINSGKLRMFDIQMTKLSSSSYSESITKSSFKYGTAATDKISIEENTYLAGYLYTYNVKQRAGSQDPSQMEGAFEPQKDENKQPIAGTVLAEKYEIDED